MKKRLSPSVAANLLGLPVQFVRVGMQQGRLPIGTVVKFKTYSYDIRPNKLAEYMGISVAELESRIQRLAS